MDVQQGALVCKVFAGEISFHNKSTQQPGCKNGLKNCAAEATVGSMSNTEVVPSGIGSLLAMLEQGHEIVCRSATQHNMNDFEPLSINIIPWLGVYLLLGANLVFRAVLQ